MSHRIKKSTPFKQLPRRCQKTAYIGMKNQIRRAASILGGSFYTHDYLHGKNGWVDVCFLGHKAPVFYNAVLETTRAAYKEAVWDIAWERSYALAPDAAPSFLKLAVKDPKTGNYVMPAREPVRYPALDGLSRIEWIQHQLPLIADEGTVQVFEHWTLHHDYSYGIGLHATLDVPFLTIGAINAFVERFLSSESAHHSPLPYSYAYADIEHWGLESNALVEPWEWTAAKAEVAEPRLDSAQKNGTP